MAVKAQDSVTVYDFNDISKVRTWYKLVPRTSSAPTVAANATEAQMTSNGWTTTEPAVDTTKKLYTVQQNVFGDGTYVWGDVSLSSSYEAAIEAYNKASAAEGAANETAKYFWFNSTDSGAGEGAGAHITEKPKADFVADPANGGGNVLIDSDSVEVRDGINMLATFGADGAQIGANDAPRAIFGPAEMSMVNAEGTPYFSVDMDGGGREPINTKLNIVSNKSATNKSPTDHTMIVAYNGTYGPLEYVENGDSFTIEIKLSHLHKNNSSSDPYSIISERTVSHTFTKGTSESYNAPQYSISTTPDYFEYDLRITYDGANALFIYVFNFNRTVGNSAYNYRITINEASFTSDIIAVVPLLEMTGKYHINLFVDSSASSSKDATSGSDKDLFNAIRSLGWYSDVIV